MIQKHDHVTYRNWTGYCVISAIVRTVHRDGTATVEARFVLDDQGQPQPGYLGYRYRFDQDMLTPVGPKGGC